jgi:geranylgeranylglyceryl phosphate synthase family protein
MLETFRLNRPALREIPQTARLIYAAQKARRFVELSPVEMGEAGLYASSREGIWMYLVDESLRPFGVTVSVEQKRVLADLFSVLRRIYKSADDAWDQSLEVREYVSSDPLGRVAEPLTWGNQGAGNITHLSPLFNYLNLRLLRYFPDDEYKRNRIREEYESFVKAAAFALVEFEELRLGGRPDWRDCFDFYKKTTGRIGEAVGSIVGELIGADDEIKQRLKFNLTQAALVSQLADDVRDLPFDTLDDRSPSAVKSMLSLLPDEYNSVVNFAYKHGPHLSYRVFKRLAPLTANRVEKFLYFDCLNNLPRKIQKFLRDFFYTLPPMVVSHEDPLNKGWPTAPEADLRISNYVGRSREDEPYKLVNFIKLSEDPYQHHLAMLIDPARQPIEVAAQRVSNFIDLGGTVILIGGSGEIDSFIFQGTVEAITRITKSLDQISVIIFPGHLGQIPETGEGITGVLNYQYILGSPKTDNFDEAYPVEARRQVEKILQERNLTSISTLYVLCGDPEASVSQVTGISPIDLQQPAQVDYLLFKVEEWLKRGIACVYLEGGSGSSRPVTPEIVGQVRGFIDRYSPQTLLFVGGGINSPEEVRAVVPKANCVVIGTHFETSNIAEMENLLSALTQ